MLHRPIETTPEKGKAQVGVSSAGNWEQAYEIDLGMLYEHPAKLPYAVFREMRVW